jgi:hypothetical protein
MSDSNTPLDLSTTISVSKTNYNRFRSGSHSLEKVLRLEGYRIEMGMVIGEDRQIALHSVKLCLRPKEIEIVVPTLPTVKDN